MRLAVVTESRFFSRDIQTRVWGFQGLTAAVKAWMMGTSPGKGPLKAHPWAAWVRLEDCKIGLQLTHICLQSLEVSCKLKLILHHKCERTYIL